MKEPFWLWLPWTLFFCSFDTHANSRNPHTVLETHSHNPSCSINTPPYPTVTVTIVPCGTSFFVALPGSSRGSKSSLARGLTRSGSQLPCASVCDTSAASVCVCLVSPFFVASWSWGVLPQRPFCFATAGRHISTFNSAFWYTLDQRRVR
jgi:hypothetical protein